MLKDKAFLKFLLIFFGVFLLCYYGAMLLSGLAVPGGSYSPFVEKYFNIASWMRTALINSSKWLLSLTGTESFRADEYVLRSASGKAIRLVYSCLGFGVMSFWTAYIISSHAFWKKKLLWLIAGLAALFIINALRLALVLKAADKGWNFPFGWDHHTWFNIVAYLFIFAMIFFFAAKNKSYERA